MANWQQLPRDLDGEAFAKWLASALEREGYSRPVKQEIEDWLYTQTGRTVIVREDAKAKGGAK